MHGSVDGIHLVGAGGRSKVNQPDVFFIFPAFKQDRIYCIIDEGLELFKVFQGNPAEAEFDAAEMKDAGDVIVQLGKRSHLLIGGSICFQLFFQFCFPVI